MKQVVVVAGPSGSGKSWVCKQCTDAFEYVSHDDNERKALPKLIERAFYTKGKVIVDCPFYVSGLVNEIKAMGMPVSLLYIVEAPDVVSARIKQRAGHVPKQSKVEYMNARAKQQADFYGTSTQVLNKIKEMAK